MSEESKITIDLRAKEGEPALDHLNRIVSENYRVPGTGAASEATIIVVAEGASATPEEIERSEAAGRAAMKKLRPRRGGKKG